MDVPQRAPLVYVSFSAEINPTTTETLINAMGGLANKEVVANIFGEGLVFTTPNCYNDGKDTRKYS